MSAPRPERSAPTPYAYSMGDASAVIGVSPRFVEGLVAQRRLPSAKINGRRVIRRVDLERMVDAKIEDGYAFRPPETIREAVIADAELKRLADDLTKQARRSKDPEVADFCFLAARAYTQLATFYRWNAGLQEFSLEEGNTAS